ncbi:MAG: hypothetical protein A3F14_04125 [Gammaproteobacteria bacterium RIFCSPHIGHO2_12_FULL_43_28]|nr:MAG: hypothetical protein A3F14_04125 [Gammaproteobacteria bacterium RIFCSPHIGHO2_12_FULL_43_28]
MYTDDRNAYRQTYFTAWQKHLKKLPMDGVESQLAAIIEAHPEYHPLLEKEGQTDNFAVEENPFVHMSLHLALRDQVLTNRPQGIAQIYQALHEKYPSIHEREHVMIGALAHMLWQGQESGSMPSEADYLAKLRGI